MLIIKSIGAVVATKREKEIKTANIAINEYKLLIEDYKEEYGNHEKIKDISQKLYEEQRLVNLLENGHKVSHPFCSLKYEIDRKYGIKTEQLYEGQLWTNFNRPYRNKRPFYLLKDLPYNFKGKGGEFQHYKIGEVISDKVILECITRYYKMVTFREHHVIRDYGWGKEREITKTEINHLLFRDQKNRLYAKAIPIRQMFNCLLYESTPTKRKGEYVTKDGFKWRIKHNDFYHLWDWVQNTVNNDISMEGHYVLNTINGYEPEPNMQKYRKNNKKGWRKIS